MTKPGRPSSYSDEVAEIICDRIAQGESLGAICADHGISPNTVRRWLDAESAFSARYARARQMQAEVLAEKIRSVADLCTTETAAGDRVKIGAYQWLAGRLDPKRWGDRVENVVVGQDGGPVVHEVRRVIVDKSE